MYNHVIHKPKFKYIFTHCSICFTMEIKIGDIVALKSGGPYMTVDYIIGHNLPENSGVYYRPGIQKGNIICSWTNRAGKVCGSLYRADELEIVNVIV